MKVSLLLALAGLSAAAPGVINPTDLHKPISPTVSVVDNWSQRRAESAEATDPDADLEEFMNSPLYSLLAQEETAPYQYERVFVDQNATAIHQPIERHNFDEYDARDCASHCNHHRACMAFSIFIEREPSCTDCSNPQGVATNVCELYNILLEDEIITDAGGERNIQGGTFTHAIRASNGYNLIGRIQTVIVTQTVTVRESASAGAAVRRAATFTSSEPATATSTARQAVLVSASAPTVTKTTGEPTLMV